MSGTSLTKPCGDGNGGDHAQHQRNGQGVVAEPLQFGLAHQQAAGNHYQRGSREHGYGGVDENDESFELEGDYSDDFDDSYDDDNYEE